MPTFELINGVSTVELPNNRSPHIKLWLKEPINPQFNSAKVKVGDMLEVLNQNNTEANFKIVTNGNSDIKIINNGPATIKFQYNTH